MNTYQEQFYKSANHDHIAKQVRIDGFDPICISDPPNHLYPMHQHSETTLLVILKGDMDMKIVENN